MISSAFISIATIPLTVAVTWPLPVALVVAAWFGFMGHRRGQAAPYWAFGGAVMALTVGVIGAGLANATAVPTTDSVVQKHQTVALVLSVLIMSVTGVLLATSTRRSS
jgi:hypothetical protein